MPNKHVISNQKIFTLVFFICCALMASLFVYHWRNKQELAVLANGDATLFPTAREIKPFELGSTQQKPFTQNSLRDHWTLLFFGFAHCSTICPTTLNMLTQAYPDLLATQPTLQVVFISLDPERDTLSSLLSYVNSFHPAFIAVTGKTQTIRKLQSQFGIFSAKDDSVHGDNYQLQHTPSILLINPNGLWAGLLKPNVPPSQFAKLFQQMTTHHA